MSRNLIKEITYQNIDNILIPLMKLNIIVEHQRLNVKDIILISKNPNIIKLVP